MFVRLDIHFLEKVFNSGNKYAGVKSISSICTYLFATQKLLSEEFVCKAYLDNDDL